AELITAEDRDLRLANAVGRKRVVGAVIRRDPVTPTCAGLGNDPNLPPGITPLHGRELAGDHTDLLGRICRPRRIGNSATRCRVRWWSELAAGSRARGERGGVGAGSPGPGAGPRPAGAQGRGVALADNAGLARDEVVEVAAVQRNVVELRAIDAAGLGSLVGF